MDYEGRICRPPQERPSYMLPVMVGCQYNRCIFCNLFQHLKFRELPLEDIEADLKRAYDTGGKPKQIFLGDGNAFGLKAERLLRILDLIHKYFPDCYTINMDATVMSIRAKTDEELKALSDNGVNLLYIGIEGGLDDVLKFMKKDHDQAQAYEAIRRIHEAGMDYCAHIMNGVAGEGRGLENAEAVGKFFLETHPKHIVNYTLLVRTGTELYSQYENGAFRPASEQESLEEERRLLEILSRTDEEHPIRYDGFHHLIEIRSRGVLPYDAEKLIQGLDEKIAIGKTMNPIYNIQRRK